MIQNLLCSTPTLTNVTQITRADFEILESKLLKIYSPMLASDAPLKINILLYNNVNILGEVLSSIVYISDITLPEIRLELIFDKYNFGKNSTVELTQVLPETSVLWRNADIVNVEKFTKYSGILHTHPHYRNYDINTDLSIEPYDGSLLFDGWYTLLTLTPLEAPTLLWDGVLRSNVTDTTVEYYYGGTWINIAENIQEFARIANNLRIENDESRNYKHDFIILNDILISFETLITKDIREEAFVQSSKIRNIYNTVSSLFLNGKYEEAQYILNSIDLTLIQ